MGALNSIFTLTVIVLLTNPAFTQNDPPSNASFVWTEAESEKRLQAAYFRYEVNLEDVPTSATLKLFADSRYHLLINGTFVQFGPARFYPENPEYDDFDLLPYLKKGVNVIAVKVMSNGVSTFQLRKNQAGFIAWGHIQSASGQHIDLSTPGAWKAYSVQGYDEHAARMTFALGPMEIYDARKDADVQAWEKVGFDDSEWAQAVPLKNQKIWGRFTPRSIPPLSSEIFHPRQLLGVYSWKQTEEIYSFEILKHERSWNEFRQSSPFVGYTYIYSPHAQVVNAGIWWGEHFLNGEGPLKQEDAGPERPHRQQTTLQLQKGWNYFFVGRKSFFGKWAFMLALPKDAGLHLSPNQKMNDPVFFNTTGPLPEEGWDEVLTSLKDQYSEKESFEWKAHKRSDLSGNPAIEMAWQYFDKKQKIPDWQRKDIVLNELNGSSLVYDFRFKKLARILIDFEAPAGTVLDVGITEDLLGKQANVMKRNGLYMATRHIAAGGAGRLETFKPYGLRYLQLNVHQNNGPVRIKKVRVIQHIYPFEQTGAFTCSDPVLNDIWELGWRTLQVCAEDSYTDTPFRERGLYAGDMLPQMGITLAGSNDLRLVKRSLRLFQDMYVDQFNPGVPRHPDEIDLLEDYPLLTLEALAWYVDRTGDLAFAKELWPAYERLLKNVWERRDENGLIHNQRVFIEWTQIEKSNVKNTAYHAIFTRSLELMARLADILGKTEEARAYRKNHQEMGQTLSRHFWNPEKNLFSDGIKDGKQIDHYYAISSVWPYLAGLTDSTMNQHIFPYIAEELRDIGSISRRKKATPYGGFYLLSALYDQGMAEVAERFIRQHWSPYGTKAQ